MTDAVNKPGAEYEAMAPAWAMPRALMGGTTAMREAGETYLPRDPGESDDAYKNRKNRSTLFNAFKKTINAATSKVFSKKIIVGEDVPEQIAGWLVNIDNAGQDLTGFAANVFKDAMQVGLSYVFVDMPPALPAGSTKADEKRANRRPYAVHIKAEDLIDWSTGLVNGETVLTQIRFRQIVTVEDGQFGKKQAKQVRVITPHNFQVWEEKEGKSKGEKHWEVVDEGVLTIGRIPLAVFYVNRTGFMRAEPPLEDLAHMNVAHWQSSSDQRNILHVARVPMLFGRNLEISENKSGKMEYGANRMIVSNDPQGDLKFVEHSGAAIGAGRQDLVDIEDRMRVLGLELFMQKTGTQTATGKAIDSAEQNSTVKMAAVALQACMIGVLELMGAWVGVEETGTVSVNTDYGVSMSDSVELGILLNARLAGEISRETFWSELIRRNLLIDGFDMDEESGRLENELPGTEEIEQNGVG